MSENFQFDTVNNGYDPYQVNSEIRRLKAQIKALNERIMLYQNQIETVSSQFNIIKQRYQTLVSELSMREKAADDVARIALREANSVIETAQRNADDIVNEAIINSQNVMNQAKLYNTESLKIRKQLREQMASFIEILDGSDNPATDENKD